jgi:uncharacterized protein (TIGR02599 family)
MNASLYISSRRAGAFTLVEMLVSTAIIALIMLVLVSITNQTAQTWSYTTEKIEKFQKARDGFESMTRRLSQATLNTYWDYLGVVPPSPTLAPRNKQIEHDDYKNFIPLSYGRMSELRFLSGPMTGSGTSALVPDGPPSGSDDQEAYWPTHGVFFQAPLGIVNDTDDTISKLKLPAGSTYGAMDNLLNTWGYFLEVGYELDRPPFITPAMSPKRWRSRLMEFMQPAEKMGVYELKYPTSSTGWNIITSWISAPLQVSRTSPDRPARTLAENVIALIILPKLSKEDQVARGASASPLSPNYMYDSTKTANPGNTAGDSEINPKNQLPPIVQVTMVAIDERSAARLVDKDGKSHVIGPDTSTMFRQKSETLEKPETGELAEYERLLVEKGATYRIFNTNVSIKSSKWSRSQTQ